MNLFRSYRVLALFVGVLLAVSCLMSIFAHFLTQGSSLQQFGDSMLWLWMIHGWVFMVYVVVAFFLSRREGWTPVFTITALAAGLIPLLIFWVEHKVAERYKSEHPEEFATPA